MVTAALVTPEVTPQAALLNGKVVAKNGQAVASANNKRHHPVTKDHIKVRPPKMLWSRSDVEAHIQRREML